MNMQGDIRPTTMIDGDIAIDKDVPIPMLDGAVLYCNVFRPAKPGKYPPVIAFTPYNKDSDVAVDFKRYWDFVLKDHPEVVQGESTGKYLTWEVPDPERWVPRGYAIVVVDARGTGKSPGYYELQSPMQTRDVYDVIEWAGVQDWSNGKVGMLGVSYLALKQWQVAALQPPHLAALIPWEGFYDHYRDFYRHGGIFSAAFIKLLWESQFKVNLNGNADTPYRDRFTGEIATGKPLNPQLVLSNVANMLEAGERHVLDDAYFQERKARPERMVVPFLSAANWGGLGLHLRGNVEAYETAAAERKWIEFHDDTHFASMYVPEAVKLQLRFFDYFLKGEDNGWGDEPPVLMTVRDPRGFYRRKENEWPLARTEWTEYYLDAGSESMSTEAPAKGASAAYKALEKEVTFWSAPFEQDTEFTGPVAARLWVSSSTTDMDLFLTLRAFDPDGKEVTFRGANDPQAPVSQGWLRVSHRKTDPERSTPYRPFHTHDEIQKLNPGEVHQVDVEVWPTCIVLPKGYRLALTVGGKDFERPEATGLMRGSGLFIHNDPTDRPADEFGGTNTIHTGGARRSHLLLPRIPA